jgi:type IV pilus assembly protein PilQ
VAVNVKVIDITLGNTASFTSSFSFAVDDAFIVSEGGRAGVNVGEFAPAGLNEANDETLNRPLIDNPYSGLPVGVDFNDVITVPSAPGQGIRIINNTTGQIVGEIPVTGGAFARNPILTDDARQRILQVTDGAPGSLRFTDSNANGVFDSGDAINSFANATLGTLTQSLPSQIRYPSDILLRLRAQVVSGNAKILTDPTLVVQEGQSASVNLTSKVVTNVTETAGTGDNAVPAINNEFEEVGLSITIGVPRVDDNGFITMEIQPRISSPTPDSNVVQTSLGPFAVSQVAKRELNSGRIRLRDGQSLILAGIIQETDSETITKWPILGDIPILGALFRNSLSNKDRSEVIIVVTPQILDDSDASNFGYSYTPSPEVQKILDQRNPR